MLLGWPSKISNSPEGCVVLLVLGDYSISVYCNGLFYFYFTSIVSVLYIDTSVKTFLSMYGGWRFCHVKWELQVFFTDTFRCSSRVPLCAPWKISRSVCLQNHSFFRVTYIQRGLVSFVAHVSAVFVRYFITIIIILDVCDLFNNCFLLFLYGKDIAI